MTSMLNFLRHFLFRRYCFSCCRSFALIDVRIGAGLLKQRPSSFLVQVQANAPVNHLRNKMSKLAVRQSQSHCAFTLSNPRTVQRRKPCRAFTVAKRGSIIAALRRSRALPCSLARVFLIATTTALCGPISMVRPFGSRVHCAITGQSLQRQRYTRTVWPRRSFCPVKTKACC